MVLGGPSLAVLWESWGTRDHIWTLCIICIQSFERAHWPCCAFAELVTPHFPQVACSVPQAPLSQPEGNLAPRPKQKNRVFPENC